MGSDKICAKKQVPDSGPQHFKSGLPLNMFPGDAVYGREEKGASRRADQIMLSLHDRTARNANEADRASAIGTVVGRLEIDRYEGQGAPLRCEPADCEAITPISRSPVDEGCNSI
jgi:hypothetical protein